LIVRRFTDFLVYEVDQDSSVVHIKSLGMPEPSAKKAKDLGEPVSKVKVDVTSEEPSVIQESTEAGLAAEESADAIDKKDGDSSNQTSSTVPWPDLFSARLAPFLSTEKIEEVKNMFLEGPEPPFVSDAGWSGRSTAKANEIGDSGSMDIEENTEMKSDDKGKKGSSRRGRDRGGRGGRGGKPVREDHRKVISEVCVPSPAHAIVLQTSRTTADCLEANAHQLPPNDTRIIRRKVGQRD
jgi:tRNA pseudouridine13 synthase